MTNLLFCHIEIRTFPEILAPFFDACNVELDVVVAVVFVVVVVVVVAAVATVGRFLFTALNLARDTT